MKERIKAGFKQVLEMIVFAVPIVAILGISICPLLYVLVHTESDILITSASIWCFLSVNFILGFIDD